ncbi:MAG: GyrI-like domain-containing protein [Bacteroidota bacterium]|nr:GyrI-like domain-containing protein [Bacteroidota bacterium]
MDPRIETLSEKRLIGKRLRMTIANDKTFDLWRSFMPERKEIKNSLSTDLFCVQVFDASLDFKGFNPDTEFEKWAAIEVSDINYVPDNMETYTLAGGLYAVFLYKDMASNFGETFRYIFGTWLPQSIYDLDKRPHFEILGDKYKNNDPESEEEVWIPIKPKNPNK